MHGFTTLLATAAAVNGVVAASEFNILQHLGGNGQWFPGSETTGISSDIPDGCKVDVAAFFSRHGSRYPDTGAYNGWVALQKRLQEAGSSWRVTVRELEFLKTWKPVLSHPSRQIAQISPTGYQELHTMGTTWRLRYPDLYEYSTPFTMWANYYSSSPRVRDSARLFAQGFVGPNATQLTTIYALNGSDPASWMNSLAPSDLCKAYNDESGSPYRDQWEAIYVPSIRNRLNSKIHGNFSFSNDDVTSIPYLCGFESQITGLRSPFCDILTEHEVLQYEYAQDLRYWYGTGLGSDIEKYQMLPVLDMVVQRFADGPNATYKTSNGTFASPNLLASFSNDGQINQLVAALAVFDDHPQLPGNRIPPRRTFRSSRLTPMRGTVAFERLSCSASCTDSRNGYTTSSSQPGTYMRIRLNEVVYPVVGCKSGPGSSCPLSQYQNIVKSKLAQAGSFPQICNVTGPAYSNRTRASFFMDNTLPFATVVKP